jgi:hypothetical protein
MLMSGGSFKPTIKVVSRNKKDKALMTRHASTQPVNKARPSYVCQLVEQADKRQ